MDFFPSMGESGFWDELFWFGPLCLQVILGLFIFRLLGRRTTALGIGRRLAATFALVIATDVLAFAAFLVLFHIANPTL